MSYVRRTVPVRAASWAGSVNTSFPAGASEMDSWKERGAAVGPAAEGTAPAGRPAASTAAAQKRDENSLTTPSKSSSSSASPWGLSASAPAAAISATTLRGKAWKDFQLELPTPRTPKRSFPAREPSGRASAHLLKARALSGGVPLYVDVTTTASRGFSAGCCSHSVAESSVAMVGVKPLSLAAAASCSARPLQLPMLEP
mmetsp:Transcript_6834/g.19280  ORF Transcript_6834/g.19280 Transcript_6834/m.19280 type:complete len:200 (-) Transcript_6834:1788-2387(-)